MSNMINVKTLRLEMGRIVEKVGKGEDFMVLYRSRPAFRIVPVTGASIRSPAGDDSAEVTEVVARSAPALPEIDQERGFYSFR